MIESFRWQRIYLSTGKTLRNCHWGEGGVRLVNFGFGEIRINVYRWNSQKMVIRVLRMVNSMTDLIRGQRAFDMEKTHLKNLSFCRITVFDSGDNILRCPSPCRFWWNALASPKRRSKKRNHENDTSQIAGVLSCCCVPVFFNCWSSARRTEPWI